MHFTLCLLLRRFLFDPEDLTEDLPEDPFDRNHLFFLFDLPVQCCWPRQLSVLFNNGRTAVRSTGIGD